MITWKKYKNTESCFSIAFREEHPDIAKQLSNDKGWYEEGKKVVVGQYEYSVKKVPNKKEEGKFYTFIERKPYSELGEESEEQKAHTATNKEYSDGAKKGHEENVAMHKERMAIERELITAINALIDILRTRPVE